MEIHSSCCFNIKHTLLTHIIIAQVQIADAVVAFKDCLEILMIVEG